MIALRHARRLAYVQANGELTMVAIAPYNELPPPLRETSLAVADAVLAVLQSVSNSSSPRDASEHGV
jgi:hypothetical protein